MSITPEEQNQQIKEEQDSEMSYIMLASKADDKRVKYLAKKNEYKICFEDGHDEIFKRKPLTSRKNKEIDDLRSSFLNSRFTNAKSNDGQSNKIIVNGKEFDNQSSVLFEAYRLTAEYCLSMSSEQYDNAIWEDDGEYMEKDIFGLRSVLTACLLRAVHGIAYFHQP